MKRVKIAQIGIGHDHADMTFKALLTKEELFDVVGFCVIEGEEERLPSRAKYFTPERRLSLEEIFSIPDLDAVCVECDEEYLTKYCLMCAERGLHVHMDKPGSISSAEYENMLSVMKRRGKVFQSGYMYRYNPMITELMRLVDSGEFGKIYAIEAHMDCEHKKEKREWLGKFPGGMNFYLGCHLIDLIIRLQGLPNEIIPLNSSTGMDGVSSFDVGMAVFKYDNGISFAKTSAAEPGGYMRRQLVVCSDKRTWELRPLEKIVKGQEPKLKTTLTESLSGLPWKSMGDVRESEPFDRYEKMMESFYEYISGIKENPYTYEYEATLHRVLMCACGMKENYKEEIRL